ncbi:hypothetical protein OAO01_00440 [Oligoflexia bacterium]|nr:hypothetical protein [Oligoflexia bacterium]
MSYGKRLSYHSKLGAGIICKIVLRLGKMSERVDPSNTPSLPPPESQPGTGPVREELIVLVTKEGSKCGNEDLLAAEDFFRAHGFQVKHIRFGAEITPVAMAAKLESELLPLENAFALTDTKCSSAFHREGGDRRFSTPYEQIGLFHGSDWVLYHTYEQVFENPAPLAKDIQDAASDELMRLQAGNPTVDDRPYVEQQLSVEFVTRQRAALNVPERPEGHTAAYMNYMGGRISNLYRLVLSNGVRRPEQIAIVTAGLTRRSPFREHYGMLFSALEQVMGEEVDERLTAIIRGLEFGSRLGAENSDFFPSDLLARASEEAGIPVRQPHEWVSEWLVEAGFPQDRIEVLATSEDASKHCDIDYPSVWYVGEERLHFESHDFSFSWPSLPGAAANTLVDRLKAGELLAFPPKELLSGIRGIYRGPFKDLKLDSSALVAIEHQPIARELVFTYVLGQVEKTLAERVERQLLEAALPGRSAPTPEEVGNLRPARDCEGRNVDHQDLLRLESKIETVETMPDGRLIIVGYASGYNIGKPHDQYDFYAVDSGEPVCLGTVCREQWNYRMQASTTPGSFVFADCGDSVVEALYAGGEVNVTHHGDGLFLNAGMEKHNRDLFSLGPGQFVFPHQDKDSVVVMVGTDAVRLLPTDPRTGPIQDLLNIFSRDGQIHFVLKSEGRTAIFRREGDCFSEVGAFAGEDWNAVSVSPDGRSAVGRTFMGDDRRAELLLFGTDSYLSFGSFPTDIGLTVPPIMDSLCFSPDGSRVGFLEGHSGSLRDELEHGPLDKVRIRVYDVESVDGAGRFHRVLDYPYPVEVSCLKLEDNQTAIVGDGWGRVTRLEWA